MDINNIQGMNAYKANTLMADTASVRNDNNKEATGTEPNGESTRTLQEAVQVEITQQAMTLQAERKKDLVKEEQDQQLTQQGPQNGPIAQYQGQQGSWIDVVA
ncbi:hypothetical protein [Desulfobacter curvatus]|uniref:hypothetical protein n=1 Tax=Desulfobacter curvatus TaxID=2290 RepID=UPI00037871EE|nr:hypothetical protein [Desulfobacter curvatus]